LYATPGPHQDQSSRLEVSAQNSIDVRSLSRGTAKSANNLNRAKEENVASWTPRGIHARQVRLVDRDDLLDCFVLPDDSLAKIGLELFGCKADLGRIQQFLRSGHTLHPVAILVPL